MNRCFLGAKLHRMTVTGAEKDYMGSITIDSNLLDISGIKSGERVQVADIDTGSRFETYVFEGEPGSGTICINGAAANLVEVGNLVIILQYVWIDADERPPKPRVIVADNTNRNPKLLNLKECI